MDVLGRNRITKSITMSNEKQVKRISEAYNSMNLSQQIAVHELISMPVLKGIETGVVLAKDRKNINRTSQLGTRHLNACNELKTEFKIEN